MADAGTRDEAARDQRLVVALVRGLHGLRGAVRVEVLTDKPEQRYRPGAVLYREGSADPLTIASAEAVADGPGWRLRFDEITTREAADTLRNAYLEIGGTPGRGTGTRRGVLARGRRNDRPRRRRRRPRRRPGRLPGRRERGLCRARRAGSARSTCRPCARSSAIFAPRRGEIVVDAEALDLQPPKRRRRPPEAPRRPQGSHADARRKPRPADAARRTTDRMTLEVDVLTLFPSMVAGPLSESIPDGSRNEGSPRSGCTICASSAWVATDRSMTRRMAAAPAW